MVLEGQNGAGPNRLADLRLEPGPTEAKALHTSLSEREESKKPTPEWEASCPATYNTCM